MSDLISRQAVLDAFEKCHKKCCHEDKMGDGWIHYETALNEIKCVPSTEPEIVRCKDCVKHNKAHGIYCDGTFVGIRDCCPLVEIRGMAQGHEFDYQYCAYAERKTDE